MVSRQDSAEVRDAHRGLGEEGRAQARGQSLPRDPEARRPRCGLWLRTRRERRGSPHTANYRHLIREAMQMPRYMDVHKKVPGVTKKAVAEAHAKDLK